VSIAAPFGSKAIMASRHEPPDSLDYFPTPPWATRALRRHVFRHLGIEPPVSAWEPACGEGHMASVLAETIPSVFASDIFDYGRGPQHEIRDFLSAQYGVSARPGRYEWIITNPPFKSSIDFTLRALELARLGVAMLVRTQWLEGVGRYENLFRDRPPTLFAPFVERVPMVKGTWDPDASTATSYAWFVWVKDEQPRPPFWIPPGCRKSLTYPNDRERFCTFEEGPLL
jgi:hypothetical protein